MACRSSLPPNRRAHAPSKGPKTLEIARPPAGTLGRLGTAPGRGEEGSRSFGREGAGGGGGATDPAAPGGGGGGGAKNTARRGMNPTARVPS